MILRDTPRHRLTRSALVAVAVLAVAVLPGWALQNEPIAPEQPLEKSTTENALDQVTNLQFENRHLSEIVDFMVEYYDLNCVLDSRVVAPKPPRVVETVAAPGVPGVPSYGSSPVAIALLDIKPIPDGGFAAKLQTSVAKWYREGEQFEHFRLDAIHPPDSVTVTDEATGRALTLNKTPQPLTVEAPAPPTGVYAADGMVERLETENVPLREALKTMLEPLGLDFSVKDGIVWISTPEKLQTDMPGELPGLENATPEMVKNLAAGCSIEFEDRHISEITDYVTEYLGVNVVLDGRVIAPPARPGEVPNMSAGYSTDGLVRYLRMEDAPVAWALMGALRPLGLSYAVHGNVVFASTEERLAGSAPVKPRGLDEVTDLGKRLSAPYSIEFEDRDVAEIMEYLHEYGGVDIRIDPGALGPDAKLIAKQRVQYIRLMDVPLWECLHWVLAPLDLAYTTRDGGVWITTKQRLR